jgi:hypothetical protein
VGGRSGLHLKDSHFLATFLGFQEGGGTGWVLAGAIFAAWDFPACLVLIFADRCGGKWSSGNSPGGGFFVFFEELGQASIEELRSVAIETWGMDVLSRLIERKFWYGNERCGKREIGKHDLGNHGKAEAIWGFCCSPGFSTSNFAVFRPSCTRARAACVVDRGGTSL